MSDSAIFAPMCAFTLLIVAVWGRLGYVRISAGRCGVIPPEYMRVGTGPAPPEKIVSVHHHFANLFEVPVLFYLGCLSLFVAHAVDSIALLLAWFFVASRVVHTAIVLTSNRPRVRVVPYVLSCFAVWGLWLLVLRRLVWAAA